LLAGAGVRRASVSGAGLFKDAESDALVRQTFFDGIVRDCQIVIPDFGTVERIEFRGRVRFGGYLHRDLLPVLPPDSASAIAVIV
jgi:predicted secreted protein